VETVEMEHLAVAVAVLVVRQEVGQLEIMAEVALVVEMLVSLVAVAVVLEALVVLEVITHQEVEVQVYLII
tara:strand:- start:314 stop:526 length:213 start_codon:yes stop_codon:yes gene_type:complete